MARLEFAGARYVRNYHLAVPHHELVIDATKSFPPRVGRASSPDAPAPGLDDNLIIHGDNLKALKSLLPHFAGKIKCIYIDPPYNTGNENWVYNDNVNSPRHKDWLNKVVDKDCQDRHDRWLSMMMPRLKLLRELLRDDGVIFISIDDNEQHHLRMLMNEVFGEPNFVSNIIWQKKYTQSNDAKYFSDTHDFILAFAKDLSKFVINPLKRTQEQNDRYENPDKDERGPWMTSPLHAKSGSDKTYSYKFQNGTSWQPPAGTFPRYSQETLQRAEKENRIWFGKAGDAVPRMKKFLSEMKEGVVPTTIWMYDQVGSNDDAKRTLKDIFEDNIFDSPKPVSLISRIIELSCDSNDLILDSFAGSGTTAHAVLALNKVDGGNRKFILVEQEDYADTITAERVRRVIQGRVGRASSPHTTGGAKGKSGEDARPTRSMEPLGGSFTYVTLGAEYDVAKILSGKSLPKYEEMAAYVFQTATGETLDRKKIDKKNHFIGSSQFYDVYLFYEPSVEKLKSAECALKLDFVTGLPKNPKKKRLVFGAVRYVNQETLSLHDVEFSQLPYEVYRRIEDAA